MTPLDAAALAVFLALPLHLLVARHFRQLADPEYLRRHGVVIEQESALEDRAAPVGEFLGRPVPGAVTFMGMAYRFDHVATPRACEQLRPGELYLAPGLVYVLA